MAGSRLVTLAREPLLWFLLLGTALFLVPRLSASGGGAASRPIVIGAREIALLEEAFERTWLRDPTPAELEALIRKTADEEILAREAVAMGLDRDDAIVRRHLRRKLESTIAQTERIGEPTDRDLEAFLRSHPGRYAVDPRVTFRQILLSPERRGESAGADAARLLEDLRAGRGGDFAALGDATLLPAQLSDATARDVERTFGSDLAEEIARAPVGEWTGPLSSGYGLHLVLVEARTPGRTATLEEARGAVLRDWDAERTRRSVEAFYAALGKKYAVVVEPRPGSSSLERATR